VHLPVGLRAEALSPLIAKVLELKEGKWVKMNKNSVAKSCMNMLK